VTERHAVCAPSDAAILQWLADQVAQAIVHADGGPDADPDVTMGRAAISRMRELIEAMTEISAPHTCGSARGCRRGTIASQVLRESLPQVAASH